MDIYRLFTQQHNHRVANTPVDLSLFAGMAAPGAAAGNASEDARVLFGGRGVQVLSVTLPQLKSDAEKSCIRAPRKRYPGAVYLLANAQVDTNQTSHHLGNDAGKQLPLTSNTRHLFTEKARFFEVTDDRTDDLTGTPELQVCVAKVFETKKATKRFYTESKRYHELLVTFIRDTPLEDESNWYASVLLNRLMFIYFVQKRGFISADADWLHKRLAEHEQDKRPFYTGFLVLLFFQGFNRRPDERGEHEAAFASVPYLNSGLFQKHPIEERCPATEDGVEQSLARRATDLKKADLSMLVSRTVAKRELARIDPAMLSTPYVVLDVCDRWRTALVNPLTLRKGVVMPALTASRLLKVESALVVLWQHAPELKTKDPSAEITHLTEQKRYLGNHELPAHYRDQIRTHMNDQPWIAMAEKPAVRGSTWHTLAKYNELFGPLVTQCYLGTFEQSLQVRKCPRQVRVHIRTAKGETHKTVG